MTSRRPRLRALFVLASFLLSLFSFGVEPVSAQAKRKKINITGKKPARKPAKKPAAPPPVLIPVGATFEARLASLMNSPVAVSSIASLQVVEVETGRVIAERDPHLAVAPASNMKLFTTGAALDLLKPTFNHTTSVSMRGTIDATGTLNGDVKIRGGGDPTIGGRFHDGQATAVMDGWASELKRAGVQTIGGSLIFEYGYFDTQYTHPSWPEDQLVNWYEAPIASLSAQEGCVMVRVTPSKPGQRAIVELEPPNSYMTVENTCVTGGGRGVFVARRPGTNQIIVKGNVPAKTGATEIFVTVVGPIHYFANVTLETFQRNGVRLAGQVKLVGRDSSAGWKVITEHKTPLTISTYVINKKSQNHYAEQVLKTIGAEMKKDGSFSGGSAAVTEWLLKMGVPANEYNMIDGSGMSRFNRASANAFTLLLRYMWKTPYRREFVSSMPYSGEHDSRLRRRLNQAPYARQVYAKTGYISGVIGLSGYVHARSGKIYAFSFLFNRYRTGVWGVYRLQDEMLKEIVRSG